MGLDYHLLPNKISNITPESKSVNVFLLAFVFHLKGKFAVDFSYEFKNPNLQNEFENKLN